MLFRSTGDIARATTVRQAPSIGLATSGLVLVVLPIAPPTAPQLDPATDPEIVPASNPFGRGMAARGPLPLARKTVPAATSPQGHRKTAPRRKIGPDVPLEIVLEEIASPDNAERDY